jgi:gas vesicle protein
LELESEFYLLIKDQNQRKMKDGFDDVKNELKNKLDHASEEFKDKFSTAKIDLEETYDELVSNMSHKTEDVISF